MPGTRLSIDEKETIRTMLRSGYTRNQIHDATGRSIPVIQKIRDELKQSEDFDIYHKGGTISKTIPVAIVDNDKPTTEVPKKKIPSLKVKRRIVRFSGTFTGFDYIVGSDQEALVIRDDNQELKIDFKMLEAFATEMLDIAVEANQIKKMVDEI
jgi:hypothetical protein